MVSGSRSLTDLDPKYWWRGRYRMVVAPATKKCVGGGGGVGVEKLFEIVGNKVDFGFRSIVGYGFKMVIRNSNDDLNY
jgi:hypothetical protein